MFSKSVEETEKHLPQPVSNELDFSLDFQKIDDGAPKENVEAQAKDSFSLEKTKETSQSSQIITLNNPSDDSEKPKTSDQEDKQVERPEAVTSTFESETKETESVEIVPQPLTPLSKNQPQISYQVLPEVMSNQRVQVVFVNDPSSFYVQLLESCNQLLELGEKLNSVYSGKFSNFLIAFY